MTSTALEVAHLIAGYDKARGAGYLNRLQSEDLDGADVGKWQQTAPLVFYSRERDEFVVTPRGSVANSYSVPWGLEWIVRGQDRRPAFTHDDAYDGVILVCSGPGELREVAITQKQADRLLLEACVSVGMGWWRRRVIFRGPRLGGWRYFKRRA